MDRHVGPVEGTPAQQHVPDQGLNWGFTYQADEEELLYDLCRDGPEGRQSQEQLAEASRLVGVLTPDVLLQGALRLLLQRLDVVGICQTTCVCKNRKRNRPSLAGSARYCFENAARFNCAAMFEHSSEVLKELSNVEKELSVNIENLLLQKCKSAEKEGKQMAQKCRQLLAFVTKYVSHYVNVEMMQLLPKRSMHCLFHQNSFFFCEIAQNRLLEASPFFAAGTLD